jgi:hypothetical protein
MARNEFKPPSDFVAEDSGGKRNIWKWLGIGCAVIALIIGGLLAAGAWKTVSCCNEAMDSARLTMKAGEFSTEFARDLASGDIEQARAKMTEDLQSRVSVEQIEQQVANYQHFFQASPGRLSDMNVQQKPGQESTVWSLTVEFAPPAGKEKLVVMTEVISRGEGEQQQFLVDDLRFEARSRDIGSEPPAVEVLDFHRQLRGGSYEQAYRHMSSDFAQQSNLEAFRSFVREQEEVFRTGQVDIDAVSYGEQGRAKVRARLEGTGGERVQVEYDLVRPNPGVEKWLIAGVTPTYQLADPAAGANDAPDAGSAVVDSEDAGPEDTGSDAE